jgi:hypothetical protein
MGMPEPSGDVLIQRELAAARRRKLRRRRRRTRALMLWLLTAATTAVLVVIALFVKQISVLPTVARPAALSAATRNITSPAASGHASSKTSRTASGASHRVSPRSSPATPAPEVTDSSSGLAYPLLAAPWRHGCPGTLDNPMFSWTAGENAVAGHVTLGGSVIDWHALACSGQLQPTFSYSGPADLHATATSLVGALDPAYYGGVAHDITLDNTSATKVSGHQAWVVRFTVSYDEGDASQGVTWSSELGAVVVVDRGTGQAPAVFYASVPGNLGTSAVSTLVGSLQLA